MYGARTSLIVGVVASGIAVLIGLVVGLHRRLLRRLERHGPLAQRRRDARPAAAADLDRHRRGVQHDQGGLPAAGSIQPGIRVVIAVIALFSWPYIARIVRGYTLSLREKRVRRGEPLARREQHADHLPRGPAEPDRAAHRLHDAADPAGILFEAALSYLGLGVPPDTASWGGLLNQASAATTTSPGG